MPVTEEELKTIFASSCIESAARAIGCPASEMYLRMKRINLIENYILKDDANGIMRNSGEKKDVQARL